MLWTRRRQVLLLILCLLLALFVALVWRPLTTPPPPVTRAASATHLQATPVPPTYLFVINNFPHEPVKVGAQVPLMWSPTPISFSDSQVAPVPVVCTLALYGPYTSVASASLAMQHGAHIDGEPAFMAPPLELNDWDADLHAVAITLPLTLRPGYYVWISQAERAANGGSVAGEALADLVA
jgi:hypothetical protein